MSVNHECSQSNSRAHSRAQRSQSISPQRSERAQRIVNPVSPRLLPLKQAAEYLGLTLWALRERIWAGDIPVVRFSGGRKMFIDTQDLDDLIAKNKVRIT